MKTIPIEKEAMYAYFAPDGNVQVRTIAKTKAFARQMIAENEPQTWRDYERIGFVLRPVVVDIRELPASTKKTEP